LVFPKLQEFLQINAEAKILTMKQGFELKFLKTAISKRKIIIEGIQEST
jgi:hypothetical protein